MKYEEYLKIRHELEDNFRRATQTLAYEYALANSPYQVGDTVVDHIGKLLIKKIKFTTAYDGIPKCVYYGVELNKDGSIAKRQTKRAVYQSNVKIVDKQMS